MQAGILRRACNPTFASLAVEFRAAGDGGTVTTHGGLQAVHDADWKQCVLDFGHGVTGRGDELLEYLRANY
jgi:hypothetical protein